MDSLQELKDYLKEINQPLRTDWFGGHDVTVDQEWQQFKARGKTVADFYKESWTLVYHGIFFGDDQWKEPYRRFINETFNPTYSLLDYGCGVGSDGLKFMEQNYAVSFADYPSHCADFLQWRLNQRKLPHTVHTLDDVTVQADVVFAFDVLEHSSDPIEFLQAMESHGKFVAVNLLKWLTENDLHHAYNALEILDWIKSNRIVKLERDVNWAYFVVYQVPPKSKKVKSK